MSLGLKGSKVPLTVIIGIVAVRYIILPISGALIIKYAIRFGLLPSDPLYQFVLLLQFALPPAISIGLLIMISELYANNCLCVLVITPFVSLLLFWP